jgi:ferritin-like metal-binding protein YciE
MFLHPSSGTVFTFLQPGTNPFINMKENPQKHDIANESQEDRVTTIGLTSEAPIDSKLREFFVEELKDVYWAEQHLVATLPKMEAAATTEKLRAAFADHLIVTQKHVTRLQDAFSLISEEAQAKKCEAMAGITKEGEEIIDETEAGSVTRDVGLIMAAQKVEHYEIATYGGLKQLAQTLGYRDVAGLLQATLTEEKEADSLLTLIAESGVNYGAKSE